VRIRGIAIRGSSREAPAPARGPIDTVALLAVVWAAAQACFIRAGIANEMQKAQGQ